MADVAVVYKVNGRILDEYQYQAHLRKCRKQHQAAGTDVFSGGLRGPSGSPGWPMESDALACHPSQAQEMHDDSVRRGVQTEFSRRTGKPTFTDAGHRARYLKAYEVHDNDGGYRETH